MKSILRPLGIIAACAVSSADLSASPSGLANPGFETVLAMQATGEYVPYVPGSGGAPGIIPGWGRYFVMADGRYRYDESFGSLKGTLAGWADPLVLDFVESGEPAWPLEGQFSMGFVSGADANELSSDPRWSWLYPNQPPPDVRYVGRVGIYQTIHLPGDITELTCYYADLSGPNLSGGSLVLSFNNQVLGYTLEPTLGPHGPTTLLRADLTPVAGQYGELRLGIEGRGFFVVDNIIVVPEASTLAGGLSLVLAAVLATARRNPRVTPAGPPVPTGWKAGPPTRLDRG